jgi:hypothetical protein
MGDMPPENRKIEPERGGILETRLESEERKSKSENGIAGVRGQGFETDADRPQVVVLEGEVGWEAGIRAHSQGGEAELRCD